MDAFNLLICLHKENHIWCDFDDIMGPLLETFYNYRKDECPDSPLRLLWKRMSGEMNACVRCISQHYQAQHVYSSDYELDFTAPLLDVLRGLDVERVTQHLKDFNSKFTRREFLPAHDSDEVVAVIFEVSRRIFIVQEMYPPLYFLVMSLRPCGLFGLATHGFCSVAE